MPYPPDRYTGSTGERSAALRRDAFPPELARPHTKAHYLATGAVTDGQFGLYRWEMSEKDQGPDPHFHRSITESFYVLSGAVRLHDGEGWVEAGPGDFLYVPQGGIHGFKNESGEPASMLILFTPGAPREDYFERVHTVGEMSTEDKEEFFLRHDTFWV
ncbi:MAG: cupin domain-containing protein [Nocardioidaceae bacterium]|nr:cupin domain-containing protein [Nocardioidaceae bacterium]NUS51236.1 cupin domain-containing protein [Nocardioidaceae bacterium]